MGDVPHSWREACASALAESAPEELLSRIECAITALESRYAQWDAAPGTPAELNAIRETILVLKRHIKENLGADASLQVSQRGFEGDRT